jgi:hypothetical protein
MGRWTYRVAAALLSLAALGGAVRLVAPATATGPTGDPPGVRRQLAFLRGELSRGAAAQAQQQFPEGYFFAYTLYGLTWVELGQREPADQRAEALREARWALSHVDSPVGRAPFSPDLTPAYGVFYRGWTNWLRGGVLSLQPAQQRDLAEVRRFDADSAALGAAFDASASPYLTAYPDQAWPVDSTVAVASLRLHDALRPPRYGATVTRWLGQVRQRLDPATGLMPHRVDPATGAQIEVARGSSQSIIERFLVDIGPSFARQQYLRFRDRYVGWPLGLGPGIREYPSGRTVRPTWTPVRYRWGERVGDRCHPRRRPSPGRRRPVRRAGRLRRTGRGTGRHTVDQAVRVRSGTGRGRLPRLVEDRTTLGQRSAGYAGSARFVVEAVPVARDPGVRRAVTVGPGGSPRSPAPASKA